jgi:hypothetical protein
VTRSSNFLRTKPVLTRLIARYCSLDRFTLLQPVLSDSVLRIGVHWPANIIAYSSPANFIALRRELVSHSRVIYAVVSFRAVEIDKPVTCSQVYCVLL